MYRGLKMSVNLVLTGFGSCVVKKGRYKGNGSVAILLYDNNNNLLAHLSKELLDDETLSEGQFFFNELMYPDIKSELLSSIYFEDVLDNNLDFPGYPLFKVLF